MTVLRQPTKRYLEIDLSVCSWRVITFPVEISKGYVGGRGMSSYILASRFGSRIPPFSESNLLIYSVGPLVGLRTPIPGATRITMAAISPLTGLLGDANSGGDIGAYLRGLGYDGLIICGRLARPGLLYLKANGGVGFEDASEIWGLGVDATQELLTRRYAGSVVSCIGPAGENLVRYAAIVNEKQRMGGRCGLGAVMGWKQLKAVVFEPGGKHPSPVDPKTLRYIVKQAAKRVGQGLFDYDITHGTPALIDVLAALDRLPRRYWTTTQLDAADWLDIQSLKCIGEQYWRIGGSCSMWANCFLGCAGYYRPSRGKFDQFIISLSKLMRRLETRIIPHYNRYRWLKSLYLQHVVGSVDRGPEYEGFGCWGGLCDVKRNSDIVKLNSRCNDLGLDVISSANVIAFLIRCREAGVLNQFPLQIEWGDVDAMLETLTLIATRQGEGAWLAEGVQRLARRLGPEAKALAVHTKGLEWAASELRPWYGAVLSHTVASRGGDHERGMPMLEMRWQTLEPHKIQRVFSNPQILNPSCFAGKEILVKMYEDHVLLDAFGICHFHSPFFLEDLVYDPAVYSREDLLTLYQAVTGLTLTEVDISKLGDRVITAERAVNIRQGLVTVDDNCPKVFQEETVWAMGGDHRVDTRGLKEAVRHYYHVRGWNDQGIPIQDSETDRT